MQTNKQLAVFIPSGPPIELVLPAASAAFCAAAYRFWNTPGYRSLRQAAQCSSRGEKFFAPTQQIKAAVDFCRI